MHSDPSNSLIVHGPCLLSTRSTHPPSSPSLSVSILDDSPTGPPPRSNTCELIRENTITLSVHLGVASSGGGSNFGSKATTCYSLANFHHEGTQIHLIKYRSGLRLYGCAKCSLLLPWTNYVSPSPSPPEVQSSGMSSSHYIVYTVYAFTNRCADIITQV